MAQYTYDPWGKVLAANNYGGETIGTINPIRYRGYYYDAETGLYYCNSRYYDPETGRWLNADAFVSTGTGVMGYNMFAYCNNNPINMDDATGCLPKWMSGVLDVVSGICQVIGGAAIAAGASFTGVGAVAGIAIMANGVATALAGVGKIVNDATKTKTMSEENIIRTGAKAAGKKIGGKTGEKIGAAIYDTANLVADIASFTGGVNSGIKAAQVAQKAITTEKVTFMLGADRLFTDTFYVTYKYAMSTYVKFPKTWMKIVDGIGFGADATQEIIEIFED